MKRCFIVPADGPKPVSYYSHGIRVGPYLYTAGQTARAVSGRLVGVGDVTRQAKQAFHNLSLVLRDGRCRPEDVVRLNIFIRDVDDLPDIMNVKRDSFIDHCPALTVVVVESLAYPEYLLEIEAIAILDREAESR